MYSQISLREEKINKTFEKIYAVHILLLIIVYAKCLQNKCTIMIEVAEKYVKVVQTIIFDPPSAPVMHIGIS